MTRFGLLLEDVLLKDMLLKDVMLEEMVLLEERLDPGRRRR
jgi:hypothetical protein